MIAFGMSNRMNTCCAACRVAKVKCDIQQTGGTCTRCAKLGIECTVEKRRSKWDNRQAKELQTMAAPSSPQAAVYGQIITQIMQFPPNQSCCFKWKVQTLLADLIELAIKNKEAATLSWAMGQVAAHGIPLDHFEAFQRGSGALAEDESLVGSLSEPDEPLRSGTSHAEGEGEGSGEGAALPESLLPPHLSLLYSGSTPCLVAYSADAAARKRYFTNAACTLSA